MPAYPSIVQLKGIAMHQGKFGTGIGKLVKATARTLVSLPRRAWAGAIFGCAAVAFYFPDLADVFLVFALLMTFIKLGSDVVMARVTPPASGFRIGQKDGREVSVPYDKVAENFLVLGMNGASKTLAMLGLAENALRDGSGFLFVDGNGGTEVIQRVCEMASRHGREDDVLVLNYMDSWNLDPRRPQRSNTFNPFAGGSTESIVKTITGMLQDTRWIAELRSSKVTSLLTSVIGALTWMRDRQGSTLDIMTIIDGLEFKAVVDIADGGSFPGLPESIRQDARRYLGSLPMYNASRGYRQPLEATDTHAYLHMKLAALLFHTAGIYGRVFDTGRPEIDMRDVIENRRILVVVIPCLEVAPDELSELARIVVSDFIVTSEAIRKEAKETKVRETINEPSPFLVLLDQYGYYSVDGMGRQVARSGQPYVLGAVDIPKLQRLTDAEAQAIIANTNIKIFMPAEEPEQTVGLEASAQEDYGPHTKLTEEEAMSIIASTNTKIFMRTEEPEQTIGLAVKSGAKGLKSSKHTGEEANGAQDTSSTTIRKPDQHRASLVTDTDFLLGLKSPKFLWPSYRRRRWWDGKEKHWPSLGIKVVQADGVSDIEAYLPDLGTRGFRSNQFIVLPTKGKKS